MTEERLQLLPENFLREIAIKEGVGFNDNIDKQDLIDLIIDAIEEDRDEDKLTNNPAMQIKERKFDITLNEQFDFGEDKYPLPEKYNVTKIVLLLRDPAWAYTYWDIKESDITALKCGASQGGLFLRVYEIKSEKISKDNIIGYSDIPVSISDNSWYVNLPEPGVFYCVDLMILNDDTEKVLCRSNFVKSPMWEMGASGEFEEFKGYGNDLLIVAGAYALSPSETDGKIPQRIMSMIDSEFLE
ncbi:MAG: DUF4912 domain-containing protein [Spirochaetales bacterium]|nr:DUF4912 domain-containing protein [Spirochaetales bacterium]